MTMTTPSEGELERQDLLQIVQDRMNRYVALLRLWNEQRFIEVLEMIESDIEQHWPRLQPPVEQSLVDRLHQAMTPSNSTTQMMAPSPRITQLTLEEAQAKCVDAPPSSSSTPDYMRGRPRWVTPKVAAKLTGYAANTLVDMVRDGRIPPAVYRRRGNPAGKLAFWEFYGPWIEQFNRGTNPIPGSRLENIPEHYQRLKEKSQF